MIYIKYLKGLLANVWYINIYFVIYMGCFKDFKGIV
jgi:hypothetical protein